MTIKGTEEHGLLQMIIRMIKPPLCSSIPLQKVVCKEDRSPDDQNQGDKGAGIVAMIIQMIGPPLFLCKRSFICPSDDQDQRDGGARIVANDHRDDPASSVLLHSFVNGHLQRGRSPWITNIFLVRWG